MIFNEGYQRTISTAFAKITIAVSLIIKLLELQKIIINDNDKLIIKSQLSEFCTLDMLMVKRLAATTDNLDSLYIGRNIIDNIKTILKKYIEQLPEQSDKLTAKGIILDAMRNDLESALKQFTKKIDSLESNTRNLTHKP